MVEQSIVTDALDNLRVHQRKLDADGCEVGVSRQALNDVIIYVGRLMGELAALKHDIERQVEVNAELATENERLREALSRTGAVKVKALEWEERKTRLGTVWWSAPNPLGGLSIEAASENDKIAAQADFEHRILSALEPAAQEARQDDEPAAWRYRWRAGGDWKLTFHFDNGLDPEKYEQEPLYTRPAEAMVDKVLDAAGDYMGAQYGNTALHHPTDRARIKAAMEAGRHD